MIKIALALALFFSTLAHGMEGDAEILHAAIKAHNLEQVEALITQGMSIDTRDARGMLPIHQAARVGSIPITRYLVEHGARIDSLFQSNLQPIHIAAQAGHKKLVRWLIKHGADKNASLTKTLQVRPLNLALREKRQDVIQYLIEIGARADLTDDLIEDALDGQFKRLVSSLIRNTPDEESLYEKIAQSLPDQDVIKQILLVAVAYGREALIDKLLNARDLLGIDDTMLQRALLRASVTAQSAIVSKILAQACIGDARESWKKTLSKALLYAACQLDENTIDHILSYDLDNILNTDLDLVGRYLHRMIANKDMSTREKEAYRRILKNITRFARSRIIIPFIANNDDLPRLPDELNFLIRDYFLQP